MPRSMTLGNPRRGTTPPRSPPPCRYRRLVLAFRSSQPGGPRFTRLRGSITPPFGCGRVVARSTLRDRPHGRPRQTRFAVGGYPFGGWNHTNSVQPASWRTGRPVRESSACPHAWSDFTRSPTECPERSGLQSASGVSATMTRPWGRIGRSRTGGAGPRRLENQPRRAFSPPGLHGVPGVSSGRLGT